MGETVRAFCEQCGITLDLHDGPDSCTSAEMKAGVIERFFGRVRGEQP